MFAAIDQTLMSQSCLIWWSEEDAKIHGVRARRECCASAQIRLMDLMNLEWTQRKSGASFTQTLLRYAGIKAKSYG